MSDHAHPPDPPAASSSSEDNEDVEEGASSWLRRCCCCCCPTSSSGRRRRRRATGRGSRTSPVDNEQGSEWRRRQRRRLLVQISGDSAGVTTATAGEEVVTVSTDREFVDALVLQTLSVIRSLVDNDQEPPPSMIRLHSIADREPGWLSVVVSMVEVIPRRDPLGPANITLLLDDCPLPSKETIACLVKAIDLRPVAWAEATEADPVDANRHQNICVVLGCLADKLSGPRSVDIFDDEVLDYLLSHLCPCADPAVVLFSLVALEKFAQTSENKSTIQRRFSSSTPHPLVTMAEASTADADRADDPLWRQVLFSVTWYLDNLFLVPERQLSYLTADTSRLNAMLNSNDVSEYLKIGPDGLEARCDASSFESVRCTHQVFAGAWFFEVEVLTAGIMQIGWATKDSKFLNHDGYGVGDDDSSVAYDGCRQLLWYDAASRSLPSAPRWEPGHVVGCLLDLDAGEAVFFHNGRRVVAFSEMFKKRKKGRDEREGFFAGASFMSFQQCRFNFGSDPFRFPPSASSFRTFEECGRLSDEERRILPRHLKMELLRRSSVREEEACTLCFDRRASVVLAPCGHGGICGECARQLEQCAMCRADIGEIREAPSAASQREDER